MIRPLPLLTHLQVPGTFWDGYKLHSKCHKIELTFKALQNSSPPNSGVWIQCFIWSLACNIITVKGEIKKSSMNISHTCYSPSVLLCDRMIQLLFTEEPLTWWKRENSIFYYILQKYFYFMFNNQIKQINLLYLSGLWWYIRGLLTSEA